MRWAWALVAGLAAGVPSWAADDAAEIIDRAVKAHGGAEKLAKLAAYTQSARGSVNIAGNEFQATRAARYRLPDRLRWDLDMATPNQKLPLLLALAPDKGWRRSHGQTEPMTFTEEAGIRDEAYVYWLATVLPLKDAGTTGTLAGEITHEGRPAQGVKVSRKGKPDAVLYFDRESGLLVKAAFRGRDTGLAVTKEFSYGGHKDFEGVMLPTKLTDRVNGKKLGEWTVTEYRFPASIDDSTFAKP
jgi:hypothetical protein